MTSILKRTRAALRDGFVQIRATNLALISAGVAFYCMLSLFPAIAALIALLSLISNPSVVIAQLEQMQGFLPQDVYLILHEQIVSLVTASSDTLGWAGAISIAAALWSARAGVAAIMMGLNEVYGEDNRNAASHYFRALLLTLGLVTVGIVALLTLVVAPIALAFFPLEGGAGIIVETLRWLIAVSVLLMGVSVLYRFGPNLDRPSYRSVLWGAIFAVVSWGSLSVLFSYYVANFGNYNQVYGSIGAVIAMLLWLWLSSFLILLGAVVNAQIDKHVIGSVLGE
ncbi:YihY/virulence factor BrkB family protein [Sulfitobacter donghicola]|uniref:Ribonuclease BN n=1 Tax=Sulfitobacter donghicola DSW-25 = KCTC 12864 = JCM 14565 TaxID=1300350 RepID=A0A073IML7_9RHOB|nr:YihY/virulence factor BrkB family protein [Sulfitobacter donghicola]KEJ90835.1 ribonuclease BN [Sulfitobacter donghicola DSW-25 = KCTC 12864 = JCM 14565]KIN68111.1 Ribonuclease BN [Sulfitobacter donghicola DSW-25 = KCTC 12864 = JCM 14565]